MIANEIVSDWHFQENSKFCVVSFLASHKKHGITCSVVTNFAETAQRLAVRCILSAGLEEYLSPVKTHDLQMQPDL
jgi:hypothetical protein